ncbi:MAG: Tim44/TimA family putative adaptor protein [Rhodobacteraceae bacterium]|nr:Tim44/TimA family putative adaptor protein [Paracoccaceae bacterium]
MNSAVIQLLVLAGIAIFLILRLRSVLGTRDGFERPALPAAPEAPQNSKLRVVPSRVPGAPDSDITDHVAEGSPAARALEAMKTVEPAFNVGDFLRGARGAYEMILMAFQKGDIEAVQPFLGSDVRDSFEQTIATRRAQGLTVDATFVGIRELTLDSATCDEATKVADIIVRFVAEITLVVRNAAGEVVEGSPTEIRRQKDVWTFSRRMGSTDPNWHLVATGE